MARLVELIPYLEQGYSLQCCDGRLSLVPERRAGSIVVSRQKQETKERLYFPTEHSLAEIPAMQGMWEYGVLFLDAQGQEYRLDTLTQIEAAIEHNAPHTLWGQLPPTSARRTPIGPTEFKSEG